MTPAGLDGLQELLREVARSVLEEAGPGLMEMLAPRLVEAVKAALDHEAEGQRSAAYLTIKEAAAVMSCHPQTIRRLIRDRKLGRYSVGSEPRVKVSDIHAYMGREGPGSPTIDIDAKARELLAR